MKKHYFKSLAFATALLHMGGGSVQAEDFSIGDHVTVNGTEYVIRSLNMFSNGDFSTQNTSGWTQSGYTVKMTGGYDGGAYVELKDVGAGAALRQAIPVVNGKNYYYAVYAKGNSSNTNGNARLIANNDGGTAGNNIDATKMQYGTDWKKTEAIFTATTSNVTQLTSWSDKLMADGYQLYEVVAVDEALAALYSDAVAAGKKALEISNSKVGVAFKTDRAKLQELVNIGTPEDYATATTAIYEAIDKVVNLHEGDAVMLNDVKYIVGANLFQNGNFADGTTGWTGGNYAGTPTLYTFKNGGLANSAFVKTFAGGSAAATTLTQSVSVTVGKSYIFNVLTGGKPATSNNYQYHKLCKMTSATAEDATITEFKWGAADTWTRTEKMFNADGDRIGVRMSWNENTAFDEFYLAELTAVDLDYATLNSAIAKSELLNSAIPNADLATALDKAKDAKDGAITQIELDNATAALNDVLTTALNNIPNESNFTSVVSSPSFEDGKGNWDWNSASETGIVNNSDSKFTTEGVDGARLFNTWGGTAEKYVTQKLTNLPTGYYTLTASYASDANFTATLYAGAESVTTTADATGKGMFVDYTTAPVKVEDGTLEIGIKSTNWYKVDNFRLTYYTVEGGEAIMDEAKAAVAAANLKGVKANLQNEINAARALAKPNYGTAGFQKPADEEDNYASLQDAIAVAEDAVENATDLDAVNAAKNALASAVEKVKTVTFNAPGSEEVFNICERYDGWRHDGSPLTLKVNSNGNGGGQFFDGSTINANYAQQWTLTVVDEVEGTYTLSSVEADGTRYYICTGVVYGGSTSQVRTTSDAAKAMVIKVEPTDYTCKVFKLKNMEANQYLGDQDNKATGGLFTVDSHSTFTITPATKPEVEVTVKAGKFAGRIFPFKPEALPAGIKAYTCAKVNGSELELTEVTELKANTPYLLENTTDADYTATQTGFGTAVQMQYPEGELIGDYASEGNLDKGVYVLQTLDDKQAFYLVEDEDFPRAAYRVQVKAQENANVRSIGFPGTTDAINALLGGEVKAEAVYSVNGVRRNGLQKGVNIIRLSNGKTQKVIVK